MKILILLLLLCSSAYAETISIVAPYNAGWPNATVFRKLIDHANGAQTKYNFILEFKPGGDQLIAPQHVNSDTNNRIMIAAPKFAEHLLSGKIERNEFIPIHALGDACWVVISTIGNEKEGISSLRNSDIFVGSVGIGNATHMTALDIGDKYASKVTYIPYKSNAEALISMVANDGLNLVIERPISFETYKVKNAKLKMLAASCPHRLVQYPNVKTLKEQGIDAPTVFFITMASSRMDKERQSEIGRILNSSTLAIGRDEISRMSDCIPPIFLNIDILEFYNSRISNMEKYIKKFSDTIRAQQWQ
jgi:tripartite-type tricarboxylate transporter receptor subunit TctC